MKELINALKEEIDKGNIKKESVVKNLFLKDNVIDLSNLNFLDYKVNINLEGIKTKGNIYNNNQEAKNIDNAGQVAKYLVVNSFQKSFSGNIINENQSASFISNENQNPITAICFAGTAKKVKR